MKSTIKQLAFAILISIAGTSCSNGFLDIDPEQNVSAENAVVDEITLKTALNGVYSEMQDSEYYGRSFYVIPELMADNLFLSSRNTGRYLDFDNFIVSERDAYVEGLWIRLYSVLANASRVIEGGEGLESGSSDQQLRFDQLVGEAYAIRALAHFDLVRLFAQPYNFTSEANHPGIPIISRVHNERIAPPRNSVREVYQQINADLERAIGKMTLTKQAGRFSVSAAHALAARVALYQEDYDAAIFHSSEVIDSGIYNLVDTDSYPDLWAKDFNSESIFEIINTVSDNSGTNGLGHFFDVTGYADALVTFNLIDQYEVSDVRLSAIIPGAKPGAENNANFVGKFPKGTRHDDHIRVLRLAEQYLIRAESYAKTNQENLAQQDLLKVMHRAHADGVSVAEVGDALMDRILLERRKELAFEGHRLFDLNRSKKDVNMVQGDKSTLISYPNERFILPIPLSELNANSNIEQNPGY